MIKLKLIKPIEKMIKISQKKGIFFTAAAVMMIAILMLTFSPPKPLALEQELSSLKVRAESVTQHAKTVRGGYLQQVIFIAAYNAFHSLAEYLRQRSDYYFASSEIFDATFKEVMINGTICCDLAGAPAPPGPCDDAVLADVLAPSKHIGVDQCLAINNRNWRPVMRDRNLSVKLRQLENVSLLALNINTLFDKNYDNMLVRLFQNNLTGPWRVGLNVTVNYSLASGNVGVNHTENVSVIFDIAGIPDPLYLVESPTVAEDGSTLQTNYFNATNISNWNVSNLFRQIEWRFYKHDENGSSFLMRFYGVDDRSPCCGVESLINPYVMTSVNGLRERPYVDWCYYGRNNRCTLDKTGALWNVTCITKDADAEKFYRFAISTYHAIEYNVTNDEQSYLYGPRPDPACPYVPFP